VRAPGAYIEPDARARASAFQAMGRDMRAELQAMADEIKQSLELLRRHL
jgi:hypothetical protein